MIILSRELKQFFAGAATGSFFGALLAALVLEHTPMTVLWTGTMVATAIAAKDVDKKTGGDGQQ